jgi:branched-chain amino acid transport system substrate-binding protein
MKVERKSVWCSCGVAALIILSGLILMGGRASAGETVKIAFMDPYSGMAAKVGEQVQIVYKFVVDQQNKKGGILGKKIEPIYVDTEFKPPVAVRKAKKLILEENVDFIVLGTSSHIAIALSPIATKYKKILVNIGAFSNVVQGEHFSRYAFRPIFNTWAQGAGYGTYYASQPLSKFFLLNVDFVYGHDFANAVIKNLTKRNPKAEIVGDEYFSIGVKDWGPYLSKVKASGAEVLVTSARSTEVLTLLKQIHQFGLKVEVAASVANVPSVLEAAGDSAVGIVHVVGVVNTDDTPEIRQTEKLWHEMYKDHPDKDYRYPFGNAMDHINGWNFFLAAVEKAGSLDPERIINAWEGMHFTSLNGKDTQMRACDHQLILPMTVAKIEKGHNQYLGDKPYLGKPIAYISAEDAAISALPEYNPRCK